MIIQLYHEKSSYPTKIYGDLPTEVCRSKLPALKNQEKESSNRNNKDLNILLP